MTAAGLAALRPHRTTLTAAVLREAMLLRLAVARGELPADSPALAQAVAALDGLAAEAAAVEREAAPFLRCRDTRPRAPSPAATANDNGAGAAAPPSDEEGA